jgi:hypothetical protein
MLLTLPISFSVRAHEQYLLNSETYKYPHYAVCFENYPQHCVLKGPQPCAFSWNVTEFHTHTKEHKVKVCRIWSAGLSCTVLWTRSWVPTSRRIIPFPSSGLEMETTVFLGNCGATRRHNPEDQFTAVMTSSLKTVLDPVVGCTVRFGVFYAGRENKGFWTEYSRNFPNWLFVRKRAHRVLAHGTEKWLWSWLARASELVWTHSGSVPPGTEVRNWFTDRIPGDA